MSTLRGFLNDYLQMRRGLGFKLRTDGTGLVSFVAYLDQEKMDHISTAAALAWGQLPVSVQPAQWARRLTFVRGFARYCRSIDGRSEVPPMGLLSFQHQRPSPFFFQDDDIPRLLQAALDAPAKDGITHHTIHCLVGLISVTGMRISEALNLTLEDVDLEDGLLMISSSKFGKSRLVPLHESTVSILRAYHGQRDHFLRPRKTLSWFINRAGDQLGYDTALDAFRRLAKQIGLEDRIGIRRKPRLHDLRHRFAMATILQWYRQGEDVERKLPVLSAFLGHVEVSDTYWYLSACPELMNAAKDRLERHWDRRP